MSRVDHVIARRRGDDRLRRVVGRVTQVKGYRVNQLRLSEPVHKSGSPWWRERYADLIERRRKGVRK